MASKGRNTKRRDTFRRIIAADQPPCHICHNPIDYTLKHPDPHSFTIDHITPLDVTGPDGDTLDNIAAAHRKCNRDKSNRPPDWRPGCTHVTSRHW